MTKHFIKNEQGATLVEYALLVGLIGLAIAFLIQVLGQRTLALYEQVIAAPL
ncbi:Flp family type IVb pilin [Iodidimonas sp. SYSU 1G8]|uniref:Flp family type IVb pilin n=1 Tax=Iodidimonas sp. SYSU 1G8 TaxID=3133967 RepID=UPI0031FF1F93